MPRDCSVALPRDATGLSAVCDFGISWSYSLIIFEITKSNMSNNVINIDLKSV